MLNIKVRTEGAGTVMVVSAISSCIAVIMHDSVIRVGGIAHAMLPGKCRQSGHPDRFR